MQDIYRVQFNDNNNVVVNCEINRCMKINLLTSLFGADPKLNERYFNFLALKQYVVYSRKLSSFSTSSFIWMQIVKSV